MTPTSFFNKSEYTLFTLLRLCLHPSGTFGEAESVKLSKKLIYPSLNPEAWECLLALADRHEVLALLGSVLDMDKLSGKQRQVVEWKTAKTVHKGIQLQILDERITTLLEEEGIRAVTLKGCTVSRFYPVPEYRKTSDLDLFVADEKEAARAVEILEENGWKPSEKWHANHHIVLLSENQEVVELHTAWADDFKDRNLNQYLNKMQHESVQHCQLTDCSGGMVYAYETVWQGFYLLIHMLQHFVGSGFGLRNLCDWVVLWKHCVDAKVRDDFWKMVCESDTREFARAVTAICVKYLGLEEEKSPVPNIIQADWELVDGLLRDVLDAGEFGYSEAERMVGMDGTGLFAYVKEFHHQMHINFPKAGKLVFLWPVLWIETLFRFLNNNRKLNRAPVYEIMKNAGKRGQLVRRLTSVSGDRE